jgi:hypothetical protein
MRSCSSIRSTSKMLEPKSEAPVLWSDNPELVLARLRALRGKEWWR